MKHKHAELMMQYAEDAMTNNEPWLLWELNAGSPIWTVPDSHPKWSEGVGYRRKPKTISINGYDVPEPYRGEMVEDTEYYFAAMYYGVFAESFVWEGDEVDVRVQSRGLLHLTEEAAELHGKALASFTEVICTAKE